MRISHLSLLTFPFLLPARAGSKALKRCLGKEVISCVVAMRQKVTTEGSEPDTCLLVPWPGQDGSGLPSTSSCQPSREAWLINSLPSKNDAKALLSAGLRKSSYQISKMQLDLQVSSEI